MKYCPKCHAEYHEQITECADCHKKLVRKPPAKEPNALDEVDDSLKFKLYVVALILLCLGIVVSHFGLYIIGAIALAGCFIAAFVGSVYYIWKIKKRKQ